MTQHNLKSRGAAYSLPNLTLVQPEGTGGSGVALCSCGWYSEVVDSGRARKAAHAAHKAAPADDVVAPVELSDEDVDQLFDMITTEHEQDPQPEIVVEESYSESINWRGNYSIVFAPKTAELAAEFAPGLAVVQHNTSAVLRTTTVSGPEGIVKHFVPWMVTVSEDALAKLKQWQKDNRAERTGLTDMQKFLQHRQVLADELDAVADRLHQSRKDQA